MEQNNYQDLYREIMTNLLEGVMVIGMNGRITMLNPAAEHMLGLTREDIGNSFINVFQTGEGTDGFNQMILDMIYEKERVSDLSVNYILDGKIRNLSLTTSHILSNGEKSVVVVIDDVTELNELRNARTALDRIRKLSREYEKAESGSFGKSFFPGREGACGRAAVSGMVEVFGKAEIFDEAAYFAEDFPSGSAEEEE